MKRTAEMIARANQRQHVIVRFNGRDYDATLIAWKGNGMARVEFTNKRRMSVPKRVVRMPWEEAA